MGRPGIGVAVVCPELLEFPELALGTDIGGGDGPGPVGGGGEARGLNSKVHP